MPAETGIRLANGEHVVQFYDRDDDLVDVVGGYLAAAVLDGDVVIVIASPTHRDAFGLALVAAGVDVDAVQSQWRPHDARCGRDAPSVHGRRVARR